MGDCQQAGLASRQPTQFELRCRVVYALGGPALHVDDVFEEHRTPGDGEQRDQSGSVGTQGSHALADELADAAAILARDQHLEPEGRSTRRLPQRCGAPIVEFGFELSGEEDAVIAVERTELDHTNSLGSERPAVGGDDVHHPA